MLSTLSLLVSCMSLGDLHVLGSLSIKWIASIQIKYRMPPLRFEFQMSNIAWDGCILNTYYLSEIQIELCTLYFYVLNLETLS